MPDDYLPLPSTPGPYHSFGELPMSAAPYIDPNLFMQTKAAEDEEAFFTKPISQAEYDIRDNPNATYVEEMPVPAAASTTETDTAGKADTASIERGLARVLQAAMRKGVPPDALSELVNNARRIASTSRGVADDQVKGLSETYGKLRDANREATTQRMQLHREEAQSAAKMAEIQANSHRAMLLQEQARDEAIIEAEKGINQARADFNQRVAEVGGTNWGFALARSVTMLGNAIGMGMGAAAGILSGQGGNTVAPVAQQTMSMINRIIDDEVKAQRLGLNMSQRKVGMARTALQDLKTKFADDQQAEDMLRALLLEKARTELRSKTAHANEAIAMALGGEMEARLQAKQDEAETAIRHRQIELDLTSNEHLRKVYTTAEELRMRAEGLSADPRAALPPPITVGADGQFGQIEFATKPSADSDKVVRKLAGAAGQAVETIDQVITLLDESFSLGRKLDPLEANQLQGRLDNIGRNLYNAGANYTEKEIAMVRNDLLGGYELTSIAPRTWFSNTRDAAKRGRDALIRKLKGDLRGHGAIWNFEPGFEAKRKNVPLGDAAGKR